MLFLSVWGKCAGTKVPAGCYPFNAFMAAFIPSGFAPS